MIVALAGRRIDPDHADPERFPARSVAAVRARLVSAFQTRAARALVAAAACGADLLALDAAAACGMRRRIVLPFASDEFRARSVVDRSGDWGPLYDRIIASVQAANDLEVIPASTPGDHVFEAANAAILDAALALARDDGATVTAFAVWDGPIAGRTDYTEDFVRAARARGIAVVSIGILAAKENGT